MCIWFTQIRNIHLPVFPQFRPNVSTAYFLNLRHLHVSIIYLPFVATQSILSYLPLQSIKYLVLLLQVRTSQSVQGVMLAPLPLYSLYHHATPHTGSFPVTSVLKGRAVSRSFDQSMGSYLIVRFVMIFFVICFIMCFCNVLLCCFCDAFLSCSR